jgi:four helix bundle protein
VSSDQIDYNVFVEIRSYKDLVVWQKSMDLCVLVYKNTENFPKSEVYGITSQIRRACVAIPSNIAEGQMRGHKQEYIQFLRIAYASGGELETQLTIALRIDYLKTKEFQEIVGLLQEILKMLNKLISVLCSSRT